MTKIDKNDFEIAAAFKGNGALKSTQPSTN